MTDEPKKEPIQGCWEYTLDRVFDTADVIIAKVTSGKFLATVFVTWTYCTMVITCCHLVEDAKISAETFLAVMGGIAALVTMIVKDYFNKIEASKPEDTKS